LLLGEEKKLCEGFIEEAKSYLDEIIYDADKIFIFPQSRIEYKNIGLYNLSGPLLYFLASLTKKSGDNYFSKFIQAAKKVKVDMYQCKFNGSNRIQSFSYSPIERILSKLESSVSEKHLAMLKEFYDRHELEKYRYFSEYEKTHLSEFKAYYSIFDKTFPDSRLINICSETAEIILSLRQGFLIEEDILEAPPECLLHCS
jgi:hypothetical protein